MATAERLMPSSAVTGPMKAAMPAVWPGAVSASARAETPTTCQP
ncbi:hypothetical protein [Geodermatophilus sp. Leaf369]|nr:hypothetical protein [Geodermatophilus sp. Leaf369]